MFKRVAKKQGSYTTKRTRADIARAYCRREGIKLYIEPDKENELALWASWTSCPSISNKILSFIAYFTDFEDRRDTDIESAYSLFFDACLA